MITKLYAIKDAKAEVYGKPFHQTTHGEAERSFRQLIMDEKSMPHKFPDDYDLYYLGEYDDQTGLVQCLDTPQHILKAALVKQ